MNLASVRLFIEVAEAASLSKVAARRQTVQSHISRQITAFEGECGARLFRRTGRGVALTDFGQQALARLRPWLLQTEQLGEELRSAGGQVAGTVRLGLIPSAAHPLATRLFERLQQEHPAVRLDITEAQGTELDALLDAGAVDLAVLFRYRRPVGGEERPLCEAHTYLVAAPGDALTQAATVPFSRLDGLPMVLPRQPSQWRQALDDTARGLGFRLRPLAEADSLRVQMELVAARPGVYSILGPYAIAEQVRAGRLQAARLVRPELVRHVTLALPRHGKLSPPVREAARVIQSLVAGWGHQLTESVAAVQPTSSALTRRT